MFSRTRVNGYLGKAIIMKHSFPEATKEEEMNKDIEKKKIWYRYNIWHSNKEELQWRISQQKKNKNYWAGGRGSLNLCWHSLEAPHQGTSNEYPPYVLMESWSKLFPLHWQLFIRQFIIRQLWTLDDLKVCPPSPPPPPPPPPTPQKYCIQTKRQTDLNSSNTDGLFTMANSNTFFFESR